MGEYCVVCGAPLRYTNERWFSTLSGTTECQDGGSHSPNGLLPERYLTDEEVKTAEREMLAQLFALRDKLLNP